MGNICAPTVNHIRTIPQKALLRKNGCGASRMPRHAEGDPWLGRLLQKAREHALGILQRQLVPGYAEEVREEKR